MRIDAQLDAGYEEKIKAIQQATDLDTTEIIKQAFDIQHEKTTMTGRKRTKNCSKCLQAQAIAPPMVPIPAEELS